MHLGIITCEILRKEVHELIRKTRVRDVFFVVPDAANSVTVVFYHGIIDRFSQEFGANDLVMKTNTLPKIAKEIRERKLQDSIIVKVLELQMHTYPTVLLKEIEESIMRMGSVVDVILLGFGLCGNSPSALERVIRASPVPVFLPRDEQGAILNNCIEIALGKAKVQELMAEEVGTFFMTPVGASIIQEPQVLLESTINIMAGNKLKQYEPGDTKRVLQLMKGHYKRVVKIWFTEADLKDEAYAQTIEHFAREFNLEIKLIQGSSAVMRETAEKGRIRQR